MDGLRTDTHCQAIVWLATRALISRKFVNVAIFRFQRAQCSVAVRVKRSTPIQKWNKILTEFTYLYQILPTKISEMLSSIVQRGAEYAKSQKFKRSQKSRGAEWRHLLKPWTIPISEGSITCSFGDWVPKNMNSFSLLTPRQRNSRKSFEAHTVTTYWLRLFNLSKYLEKGIIDFIIHFYGFFPVNISCILCPYILPPP